MKAYSIFLTIANAVFIVLLFALDLDEDYGLFFWGAQVLAWFGFLLSIRGISYSNATVSTINDQLLGLRSMYDSGLLTEGEFEIRQKKLRLKEHVSLQNPVLSSNPMAGLKTFSIIILIVFAAISIVLFCINSIPYVVAFLLALIGMIYAIVGISYCKDRGFEANAQLIELPQKLEAGMLTHESFETTKRDLINK